MSNYFVSSTGSNTAPYDTWAKAATSLQTALTAASSPGDKVVLDVAAVPTVDKEVSADKTWTFAASISLICSTNSGTNTITPTAMGTSTWIGNSTSAANLAINGTDNTRVYIYGLTYRYPNVINARTLYINTSGSVHFTWENGYIWNGGSSGGMDPAIGNGFSSSALSSQRFIDCTFRSGSSSLGWQFTGRTALENCTQTASGTIPSPLFLCSGSSKETTVDSIGCDWSQIVGTLVGDGTTGGSKTFTFRQCKLGAGVTVLAAQTRVFEGVTVTVLDCDSGNTHYSFGHYTPLGSTVASASIYANTGGASYDIAGDKLSWLVNSTSIASENVPYVSPWITCYNEGVAAVTPYFECVRSGSATAYNDNEVWAEFTYKGTSSSTQSTFNRTDHGTGSAQTTSSLSGSDWTGESGTAWFGKLNPTGTITPVAIGDIAARVIVGKASVTDLYVDPQIRGI